MRKRWSRGKILLWLVVVLPLVTSAIAAGPAIADQPAQQPIVDKLLLDDTIQPVSQDELIRALSRADSDGARAVLVVLDTPGGLLDSTRTMAGAILSSKVPVIIYVAPAGARAGSAGFFLLESGDIAAMAPGTNAGAAHPVLEYGGQPDATMNQKIENDAEAFLRSYVTRRGRNTDAAVAAVQASHSYTAEEALNQHLIDVIANNENDLLANLEGKQITRIDGSKTTLHLSGARIVAIQPTLRDRVLSWLVNPNIALLFLVGGALLIYLEFNSPGTIVPGTLGTLMVLLAVFALNLLPVRYTAVVLLVGAIVLLVLEAKVGGHGALAVAGIICLAFGMLTLVEAPVPEMNVSPLLAISVSAAFGAITVFLVRLIARARRRKARTGADALVGCHATAMEALAPEGHVLVEGEIWQAVADAPVAAGTALRVVGHDQLLLRVEAPHTAKPAA